MSIARYLIQFVIGSFSVLVLLAPWVVLRVLQENLYGPSSELDIYYILLPESKIV